MRAWPRCPHCGHRHASRVEFCPLTGHRLPPAPRIPFRAVVWQLGLATGGVLLIVFGVMSALRSALRAPVRDQHPAVETALGGDLPESPSATRQVVKTPSSQKPTAGPRATTSPQSPVTALATVIESPSPSPTLTPTSACSQARTSRLAIGDFARVSLDPPKSNRVRSEPSRGAPVIGHILPGGTFVVLEGPTCADGSYWWYVRTEKTGLVGWTAEGDASAYWLEVVTPTPRSHPARPERALTGPAGPRDRSEEQGPT